MAKFIKNAHVNAAWAVDMAEKARLVDKAVKHGAKVVEQGAVAIKHIDTAKDIIEKAGKATTSNKSGLGALEHASWKLIKDLIAELNDATAMWKMAVKAEHAEWVNRVDDIETLKESPAFDKTRSLPKQLEPYMEELLSQLSAIFTPEDIGDLRRLYLFLLIQQWCNSPDKVWWDVYLSPRRPKVYELKGLNNTQLSQIQDWFSVAKEPGKYYGKYVSKWPPIFLPGHFFATCKIRETAHQLDVWTGRQQ